jgi:hypothetical protein
MQMRRDKSRPSESNLIGTTLLAGNEETVHFQRVHDQISKSFLNYFEWCDGTWDQMALADSLIGGWTKILSIDGPVV